MRGLKELLLRGTDLKALEGAGLLHRAARRGDLAMVCYCVDGCVCVWRQRSTRDVHTPSRSHPFFSSLPTHPKQLRLLLAAGLEVVARDEDGRTAAEAALMSGHLKVCVCVWLCLSFM